MSDTKYNGWTNYSTWRVHLEWFDDFDLGVGMGYYTQEDIDELNPSDLKNDLQELVEHQLDCEVQGTDTKVLAYALSFIGDVNWYEIANHLITNAKEEFARG
jgi:hypothetical protein